MAAYLSKQRWNTLGTYTVYKYLPLEFTVEPQSTQMYSWFGDQVFELEQNDYTFNYHKYGLDPDFFLEDEYLQALLEVTAISRLDDGTPFVASYEGKDGLPFFGTQYHPEKPVTGFYSKSKGYHEWEQIRMNKVFIERFVYGARHNTQKFSWYYSEIQDHIIENYELVKDEDGNFMYAF